MKNFSQSEIGLAPKPCCCRCVEPEVLSESPADGVLVLDTSTYTVVFNKPVGCTFTTNGFDMTMTGIGTNTLVFTPVTPISSTQTTLVIRCKCGFKFRKNLSIVT